MGKMENSVKIGANTSHQACCCTAHVKHVDNEIIYHELKRTTITATNK